MMGYIEDSRSLRLYAKVSRTRSLGPFPRFALWVQGCPFRCTGCMTPEALPANGGELVRIDGLVDEILAIDDIEGLTVSGGEPFAQATALAALILRLRASRDLGLIVYSGYRATTLRRIARDNVGVARLLAQTYLLIDGPYLAAQNDGGALRGSANQQILPLTERYLEALEVFGLDRSRNVEIHADIGVRMLVGIPSAKQLAWWRAYSKPA